MGPRAAKILGAIRGDASPVPAGIHLAPSAPVPQAVGGASSGGSRGIFHRGGLIKEVTWRVQMREEGRDPSRLR